MPFLKGLFNQRHFFVKIAEESKRAQRMGYPLCLILFDLDDFKAYNDTYGHLAGDEVLRPLAWNGDVAWKGKAGAAACDQDSTMPIQIMVVRSRFRQPVPRNPETQAA